jgi:hypothetical protein
VQAFEEALLPADQAEVGGVGEDQLKRVRRPALLARRRRTLSLELARDRGRAELALGVELEDAPGDRRFDWVGDEQPVRAGVA